MQGLRLDVLFHAFLHDTQPNLTCLGYCTCSSGNVLTIYILFSAVSMTTKNVINITAESLSNISACMNWCIMYASSHVCDLVGRVCHLLPVETPKMDEIIV